MKNAALILLIAIYSMATMGFSIKQFYCCGNLKSTTISFIKDEKQGCGKGDDKSGCCDNKYQFFKVKEKHISADILNTPAKYFVDSHLYTHSFFWNLAFASQQPVIVYRSNAPPLHKGVAIYISNSVFRI